MIRASIRRPVAVTMLYVAIALLGVTAWRNIPIELLPDVSFPQLTLSFNWLGASPETVEAFATSPIESAIQQVKGVERVISTTREGQASIVIEFARDTDMDFARLDLSERLASLEEELPPALSPVRLQPYVPQEFEEQASRPFLSYTLAGPFLIEALRAHVDDVIVPELLKIRGVSDVQVDGGRERLLEIELDPDRIAALGLRPDHAVIAVNDLQVVREAGAVREGPYTWAVTIRSRPVAAQDLRSAILRLPGTTGERPPVRLDDVGVVRDTFEEPTSHFRINGSPAVGFQVMKEYGTNTVRLAETVRNRLAELAALNPPGAGLILVSDQSEDIRREITDIRTRALIAALVVFAVLLAFLRSFATAGMVFATIAFSILIALNLVYFGGLTLNLLTLMGLVLGFGLIVDNAIVVLENIFRKWQEGSEPSEAAETGARHVVLPILASTFTTLIVFLPFLYLQGESRIYYLPLATVVGLTLLASMFVAFTFVPALSARLLGKGRGRVRRQVTVEPPVAERRSPMYIRFYSDLLGYTLRFPWVAVILAALCFGASYYVFDTFVSRGALWGGHGGDQRSRIIVTITMPRGSDLERVDELTSYFEERMAQMPEVERFTTRVQGTSSTATVEFPLELEFTAIPFAIQDQLFAYSLGFTGAEVRVRGIGPVFYGGTGGALPNYRIAILGYNYDRLAEIAEDLGARLRVNPRVHELNTNASSQFLRDRAVEFVAEIDRDAAAQHGITMRDASSLIQAALRGGERAGAVTLGGDPVAFTVRLEGFRQADVDDLLQTVIATPTGTRIPVGELVQIQERTVLTAIRREDQQYERTVAYGFRGPILFGDVVRDAALEATELPPGYSFRARRLGFITQEDAQQLILVLGVALGLVFMVAAALFESIRQPLCVLLAVPTALIGVFLTFFFVNAVFTREAYIGVIMMGGIVVNNAILLVDHINRVRSERGQLPLEEAIILGTLERIRPILMTTATTVLGLLPLVLFMPSANARIWNALTYALIGGLLSSTLFVLTTTPAFYLLFERGPARRRTLEGAPYSKTVA